MEKNPSYKRKKTSRPKKAESSRRNIRRKLLFVFHAVSSDDQR